MDRSRSGVTGEPLRRLDGTRKPTYFFLIGAVAGLLLAGVVLPFAAHDSTKELDVGAPSGAAGIASDTTPGVGDQSAQVSQRPATGLQAPGGRSAAQPTPTTALPRARTDAGSGPVSTAVQGATDRGVTPTQIKIGIPLFDLGS